MRRLLLPVCILLLAQVAEAIPARVRTAPASGTPNGGNNTGTTVTCAFASNTAGNTIIVWGAADASKTMTVADSPSGNTYTNVDVNFVTASNTSTISVWVAYNIAASAGTNTITVTLNTSASNSWCAAGEYSGLATSAALDQTHHADNTSVTAFTSGNVTTTVASEAWIGIAVGGNGSGTLSAGTNVAWGIIGTTTSGDRTLGWEDFIASTTDTQDAKLTYSVTTSGGCVIATFKSPAAAGGGGAVKKKKVIFY